MTTLELESIFSESRQLRDVIEKRCGWGLYALADLPTEKVPPEALAHIRPVKECKIGHIYLVLPLLQDGQTVADASGETKDCRPALNIDNPKKPDWVETRLEHNPHLAVFVLLRFEQDGLVADSPASKQLAEPDLVKIDYGQVVEVFEQSFFIATAWDIEKHFQKKTAWEEAMENLNDQIYYLPILNDEGELIDTIDAFPSPSP